MDSSAIVVPMAWAILAQAIVIVVLAVILHFRTENGEERARAASQEGERRMLSAIRVIKDYIENEHNK